MHTGNQHLRNHRGSSASNINSLISSMFERLVTLPVELYWKCAMDFQWHFPMEFHFCDFWCVISYHSISYHVYISLYIYI